MKKVFLAAFGVVVFAVLFGSFVARAADSDVPKFDDLSVDCQAGNGWVADFCGKVLFGRWSNNRGFGPYASVAIESSTEKGIVVYYAWGDMLPFTKAGKTRLQKATMVTKGKETYLESVSNGGAQITLRPGKNGLNGTYYYKLPDGAVWSHTTTFVEETGK